MSSVIKFKDEVFHLMETYKSDFIKVNRMFKSLNKHSISKDKVNNVLYETNRLVEKYIELSIVICGKYGNITNFCLVKGYDLVKGCLGEDKFFKYKEQVEVVNRLRDNIDVYDSSVYDALEELLDIVKEIRDCIYYESSDYLSYLDESDVKYLSNLYGSVKSFYERRLLIVKDDKEIEEMKRKYKEIIEEILDIVNILCEDAS